MSSAGNINLAFGDGGDVENLAELAGRYGYTLYDDGLWYEVCHASRTEGLCSDDCEICGGAGIIDTGKTDAEMWRWIEDRRESDAQDLALL